MRTWELTNKPGEIDVTIPFDTDALANGESVRAVELEPVLDLLERLNEGIYALANGGSIDYATLNAVNEVLVAHGRLEP